MLLLNLLHCFTDLVFLIVSLDELLDSLLFGLQWLLLHGSMGNFGAEPRIVQLEHSWPPLIEEDVIVIKLRNVGSKVLKTLVDFLEQLLSQELDPGSHD